MIIENAEEFKDAIICIATVFFSQYYCIKKRTLARWNRISEPIQSVGRHMR